MNRLTHKEALLLAVSGELSDAARRELMAEVSQDPELNADYQDVREGMELLGTMAIPEPSAEERQRIPATIKKRIHDALRQKQAGSWFSRVRYAAGGLAVMAAIAVLGGFWLSERKHARQQRAEVAKLNATIQKMESHTVPGTVPLALTNVPVPEPSNAPSLANLRDRDFMSSFIRNPNPDSENDSSAPPGSY